MAPEDDADAVIHWTYVFRFFCILCREFVAPLSQVPQPSLHKLHCCKQRDYSSITIGCRLVHPNTCTRALPLFAERRFTMAPLPVGCWWDIAAECAQSEACENIGCTGRAITRDVLRGDLSIHDRAEATTHLTVCWSGGNPARLNLEAVSTLMLRWKED